MDHRTFLRDIDDTELFAKCLEAHIAAWHQQLLTVLETWPRALLFVRGLDDEVPELYHVLGRMHVDTGRVLTEAMLRRKRLRTADSGEPSDVLSDRHLDPDNT